MRKHFYINLGNNPESADLHKILRAALPLPDAYGDNLDAFYDILTEFGSKWTLTFRGTPSQVFRQVCDDARSETPGLIIHFVKA